MQPLPKWLDSIHRLQWIMRTKDASSSHLSRTPTLRTQTSNRIARCFHSPVLCLLSLMKRECSLLKTSTSPTAYYPDSSSYLSQRTENPSFKYSSTAAQYHFQHFLQPIFSILIFNSLNKPLSPSLLNPLEAGIVHYIISRSSTATEAELTTIIALGH